MACSVSLRHAHGASAPFNFDSYSLHSSGAVHARASTHVTGRCGRTGLQGEGRLAVQSLSECAHQLGERWPPGCLASPLRPPCPPPPTQLAPCPCCPGTKNQSHLFPECSLETGCRGLRPHHCDALTMRCSEHRTRSGSTPNFQASPGFSGADPGALPATLTPTPPVPRAECRQGMRAGACHVGPNARWAAM
eukprot:155231-Chlamydomonas_euryale.AAC.4